jgi:hypothetical protein
MKILDRDGYIQGYTNKERLLLTILYTQDTITKAMAKKMLTLLLEGATEIQLVLTRKKGPIKLKQGNFTITFDYKITRK